MILENVNYIDDLKKLRLPLNKVLIVGSGTLSLLGLRKNKDLDLWVTEDIFKLMGKHNKFKPVQKHG